MELEKNEEMVKSVVTPQRAKGNSLLPIFLSSFKKNCKVHFQIIITILLLLLLLFFNVSKVAFLPNCLRGSVSTVRLYGPVAYTWL